MQHTGGATGSTETRNLGSHLSASRYRSRGLTIARPMAALACALVYIARLRYRFSTASSAKVQPSNDAAQILHEHAGRRALPRIWLPFAASRADAVVITASISSFGALPVKPWPRV